MIHTTTTATVICLLHYYNNTEESYRPCLWSSAVSRYGSTHHKMNQISAAGLLLWSTIQHQIFHTDCSHADY